MIYRNTKRGNIIHPSKLTYLLAALVGSVQGSLLLYTLPVILGSTARIILQDFAYLLFIACVWWSDGVNVKRWLLSPISVVCVLFLAIDIILQIFNGLTSREFTLFTVFRESRLLIYFLLTVLCFGSIKHWAVRNAPAVALQILFIFAGIGAVVYIILATQVVYSGEVLNFFDSKQDAIDSGFGHALHGKFKSPPIMVSFLSAYFMALLINTIPFHRFIDKVHQRSFQFVALVSVVWIALSSNARSLLIACFVGLATPFVAEVARAISLKRPRQLLFMRSITLLTLATSLIFGAVITLKYSDEKFTEQILAKDFFDDQSDAARFDAVTRAATFDFANPLGYGVGSGSNYVQLTNSWMNPIDSGTFHVLITLGYQFLIPYLVLHAIALACAFSNSLHRSDDRFDFSLQSGLLASLLISLLSFYQASPFLFPASAMLSGAAIGASISIYRSRHTIKRRSIIKNPLQVAS